MKILFVVVTMTIALALATAFNDKHASDHLQITIVNPEAGVPQAATCKLIRTDPNAPKHFWLECNDDDKTRGR